MEATRRDASSGAGFDRAPGSRLRDLARSLRGAPRAFAPGAAASAEPDRICHGWAHSPKSSSPATHAAAPKPPTYRASSGRSAQNRKPSPR